MTVNSVAVRIAGKEYRIRSDADEAWLQRVAQYVDESLSKIRDRTQTVDSLDVAILTALNLARELVTARERSSQLPDDRLRALIDLAESGLQSEAL